MQNNWNHNQLPLSLPKYYDYDYQNNNWNNVVNVIIVKQIKWHVS